MGRVRRDLRLGGTRPGLGRLPAAQERRMSYALHAEWTKLRTLASTFWLLLAAAALTVSVSAAARPPGARPGPAPTTRPRSASPASTSYLG
jgi:hypothetical protein